jgi:hypothetical protein
VRQAPSAGPPSAEDESLAQASRTATRGPADALAPLQFFNRRGAPETFNPGQTWIEALPKYSTASWPVH